VREAILRTLAYADIFDYPLTPREIHKFLISEKPLDFDSVQKALSRMSAERKRISTDKAGHFYFLTGREKLVPLRKKRKKISQKKLRVAHRIAVLLKIVPPIKLMGVTGRLAMENSEKEDDIDFLIITSKNRLWLTRLLTVFLLELLRIRRRPSNKYVKDKICLNMFLDEKHLSLPAKERDLFTAHEIVQMRPLWERGGTYGRFLKANGWVRKYLPNAMEKNIRISEYQNIRDKKGGEFLNFSISQYLNICEAFARDFQFWYMKRHRTVEVVSPHRALFHPQSARGWVLEEYKERVVKLNGAGS